MKGFNLPPISPLAGSTLPRFLSAIKKADIENTSYGNILLTALVVLCATPFHFVDKVSFDHKLSNFHLKKSPLFIIGHWRSGTTYVHNLLCQDPTAGYLTTYNSVFPNNLNSQWLFKTFMRLVMPDRRPSDGLPLDVNYPQEDEFALANINGNAYYNSFYYPKKYLDYFHRAIDFDIGEDQKEQWKQDYERLIAKALINTNGARPVIKNPVNTGRMKTLIEIYPDARFLFVYRNPVSVFLSARSFFSKIYPQLALQQVDGEQLDRLIFDVYLLLLDKYYRDIHAIPAANIQELRFEDFEARPLRALSNIYHGLLQEDYAHAESNFCEYLAKNQGHRKNRYQADKATATRIIERWGKYMDRWGYDFPADVLVT